MVRKAALVALALVAVVLVWAAYSAARHYVFWSPSEAVVFQSGNVQLAGTLVRPAAEGVFPGVVMLHGAGPDTRSGPAYRAHAKDLVRRGFAVLLYDKRGSGESGGDFESAAYRDFIDDARAAVRYLAGRDDVDRDRIGLLGASESGWFTPEIAATSEGVAFVINKVGPPLPWVDTVLFEVRNDLLAEGAAEGDVDALVELTRRIWQHVRAVAADPALADGAERVALEAAIAELPDRLRATSPLFRDGLPPYEPEAYARFAESAAYDPTPWLERLDIPMLYVFGELDINVPTAASAAYLDRLRADQGKDVTVLVLPDVGHALYTWRGLFGAGYPPGYLDFLGSWAAERGGATRAPGS